MNLKKLLSFLTCGVLFVFFALTTDYFFTWVNVNSLFREVSIVGTIAVGMTFVMMGGGIDLSVGSVCGLVMMVEARLLESIGLTSWLCIAAGLATGLACGLFTGYVVTKFNLGEFIATLAFQLLYRGCVYIVSFHDAKGNLITSTISNKLFKSFGGGVGGIYYSTIVWLILIAVSYVVLRKTKFGTYTYSCGTNRTASMMSGIDNTRVRIAHYAISGVCTAIAATFLLAWQGATTLNGGSGMEFDALVSVIVGGVALSGGSGDTIGTMSGSILMVLIVNGIYKYGISSEWQDIAKGLIILFAVSYETVKNQIAVRRERKRLFEADEAAVREV